MKRFFFGLVLVAALFTSLSMWQGQQSGKTATVSSSLNSLVQQGHQDQSTSVQGKPTISVALINSVLAAGHSPAQGTGEALYNLGVQYGLDPAYALAFFQHESSLGTSGVATVTHSLGNIKCSVGYQCFEGFRLYQTWQQGYEDWFKLIRSLYIDQWHLSTVEQIVPTYAPASDHNDVAGYIAAIEKAVQTWRTGKFASAGINWIV